MLTHENIVNAVANIAMPFSIKRASYFGSYAEGRQTEESGLDLLLEFEEEAVSLFTLSEIKYTLEEALKVSVDVIHVPLPKGSLIEIGRAVKIL